MKLGLDLRLRLAIKCAVCKQLRDEEKAGDTKVEATLFGAVALAICPCCGQKVDPQTKTYKKRALKYLEEP